MTFAGYYGTSPRCKPLNSHRKDTFHRNVSRTLSHTTWECKYHVVFISKYRKKGLYDQLRKNLGPVLKTLVAQKECQIEEGYLLSDHVHMLIDIPPKYSVAQVVGYIKGKSAIYIARIFLGHKLNYGGQLFWARGYYVSAVGRDKKTIRDYIKKQEEQDRNLNQ